METNPDDQGMVRTMILLHGIDDNSNLEWTLEHPISKLFLILEAEDFDFPMKGVWHGIKTGNHFRGTSCYRYLICESPFWTSIFQTNKWLYNSVIQMLHCINEKTIKISPFWAFSFLEFLRLSVLSFVLFFPYMEIIFV